ncbi:MAG: UvrD-helicase domain-containing protein [Pseudomonadota bacterium]
MDRPRDFEARERALDIRQSFIVQAPAGSGKTALLTRRILRLLAVVDAPEQVLAITFTRKAADEMRARVVTALREAAAESTASSAFEAAIRSDAQAVLMRDREQQWALLQMPERLQIMTVDALNARLIAARPLTSGQLGRQLVTTEQRTRFLRSSAEAMLDWVTESGETAEGIRRVFASSDFDMGFWRRQITDMLHKRDRWLPTILERLAASPETRRADSEALLEGIANRVIARVTDRLKADLLESLYTAVTFAATNLAESDPGMPVSWDVSNAVDKPAFWRAACRALLKQDDTWRTRLDVKCGFPPTAKPEKQAAVGLLGQLAVIEGLDAALAATRFLPDLYYTDTEWHDVEAMLLSLRAAAAELERVMTANATFDYPELAAQALHALGDDSAATDLALQYDYRLQHILVDEMQDTSARQYRLLERLISGWSPSDGRTLFCVGDPMQSIYRFRGAEVSLFLKAWDEGIGDYPLTPLQLTTNFRSSRPIIEWVNSSFARIFGDRSDRIEELVAHAHSDWAPNATGAGEVRWHIDTASGEDEAESVVAQVLDLLASTDGDVAILGRTRHALQPVVAALERNTVSFESVEMERLTERPEVQELITLTRLLEMPDDDIAWLGALRAPWCGLSLEQLDDMMQLRPEIVPVSIELRVQLALEKEIWPASERKTISKFLDLIGQARRGAATRSMRERVETLWGALGGPAVLTTANQLDAAFAYLSALDELENAGHLDNPAELEQLLEARKVTGGRAGARVVVMTIFSSKGLEFDHVLMPGMNIGSQSDTTPSLRMETGEIDGQTAVMFSAIASRATPGADPKGQLLAQLEAQRADNELKRLLYVATTRAKQSLHLFVATEPTTKGDRWKSPARNTLQRAIWTQALEQLPPAEAQTGDRGQNQPQEAVFAAPQRVRVAHQYRSQSEPVPNTNTPVLETEVSAEDGESTARHIGTVVHEWMRRLAGHDDPWRRFEESVDTRGRTRHALQRLGVASEALDATVDAVHALLESGVNCEQGRWVLSNRHTDSQTEFPLWTRTPTGVRRLIVDRLLRDKRGQLWIIDYKTSATDEVDSSAFFESEIQRYRPQLARYAEAIGQLPHFRSDAGKIHQALYFVAFGALVEITQGL